MNYYKKRLFWIILLVAICLSGSLTAQEGKKVLTLDDYTKWQHITDAGISPDGKWVSYGYRPNDGDQTLYFKSLGSEKIHEIAGGTRPAFSNDSRWAAYMIEPSKAESEKLEKEKKPVTGKTELLNLTDGEKFSLEGTDSFLFSENSKYFAVKMRKSDPKAKHSGSDLILRSLSDNRVLNIGNVGEFSFNKPAAHLAYTVDADQKTGNGIYLMTADTGLLRALDTSEAEYSQLTWDEEGTAMAVLKGTEDKDWVQKSNILLTFRGIDQEKIQARSYDSAKDPTFSKDMVISEFGALTWSRDNSRIFFGIKEQEKKEDNGKEKVADVDVWHWKDEVLQSEQMVRAQREQRFTYLSVFHLDSRRFVRLADEMMRSVTVTKEGSWGVGRDDKPYLLQLDLSGGKADYYRVNTLTGDKQLIEKQIGRPVGYSPDSDYFLYLKEKELWIYKPDTGEKIQVAADRPGFFVNEDDDHQYDEKPPYRPSGWTKDGKAVIMSHKFDLYKVSLDGKKIENLTKGLGEKDQIRFNLIRLDPDEDFIDLKKPLLLSAFGEWTKKSGYFRLQAGKDPVELVFEDKSYGRPIKAKNVDKVFFTRETFVEFPDYYISGLDFSNPQKVTDANPQQSEYAWGRRVLIDYENIRGIKLQATLTLPAGYEEGKKYPMLVYFYEKMSQRHHQYSMPTYDDRPHMSAYAGDGYLVLMPDIVYANGTPGTNAMECTMPAVEKVIQLGYADPERIGLQGHSWGGYESSFAVTQTDLFACVVTGAPLTNLVSMYNILYKSTGTTNQPQINYGQGRLGATPWEDLDLYISQSPVHQAQGIKVPFLILHGTADGAVDWNQGLEYYTAARRLGKKVILLSYPGESHHLAKLENQKDFQIRMKQFFDHYLKGVEAPDWMINGVPYLKKKGGKD